MSLTKKEFSKLLGHRKVILEKHLAQIHAENERELVNYVVEYYSDGSRKIGFVLYANDTVIAMRSENASMFDAVVHALRDLEHYMKLRHPNFMDNDGWSYILEGLNKW